MAKRKKKAWNASNPLYRWLNRKKTSSVKKKSRRRIKMAKRKKYSAARKGTSMGLGMVNRGLVKPTGIIGNAVMGAGAATLVENTGIQPLGQWTGVAAGFAVGGVGGALGAYLRNVIKGQGMGISSSSAGYV